jgi:Sec-independent protein translocase protein TatA
MGTMEIMVVLLAAFILLGPQRMVDAARMLGKATRELRKFTESLPQLTLDEELAEPQRSTTPRRRVGADPGPSGADRKVTESETTPPDGQPVQFRGSQAPPDEGARVSPPDDAEDQGAS